MTSVDLAAIEDVAHRVARRLGRDCHTFQSHYEDRRGLTIKSAAPATVQIDLTTIEEGTLFWHSDGGYSMEWVLGNEDSLGDLLTELDWMFAAVMSGAVSIRGTLSYDGHRRRLMAPGLPFLWISRIGRPFQPYGVRLDE